MQVQAINNNNSIDFGKSHARRERDAAVRRQQDAILSWDDDTVKLIAMESAKQDTNDKFHKNMINGLMGLVPVLYGLKDAIATRGMSGKAMAKDAMETAEKLGGKDTSLTTKFFNTIGKNLKGPAARVAAATAGALGIAGVFAIASGALVANDKAAQHVEGVRNFERKHPGTTFFGTLVGTFALLHYIPKGLSALADRIPKRNVATATKNVTKIGENFNKNSFVKSVSDGVEKLVQNAPSSLKSVGKVAVALAPIAVLVGTVAYALDHSAQKKKVANQYYNDIKDTQMNIINQRHINSEKARIAMAQKLANR